MSFACREAPGPADLLDGLDRQGGDAVAADARAAQLLGGGRGAAAAARQDGRHLRPGALAQLREGREVAAATDIDQLPTRKRNLKPQDEQLVAEILVHAKTTTTERRKTPEIFSDTCH